MILPADLADAIRRAVAAEVAMHAATRGELAEVLEQFNADRRLDPDDEAAMMLALPALHALRPRIWVGSKEVCALALTDTTAAGQQLGQALALHLQAAEPGRAVGRLLTRCSRRPIGQFYLRRQDPMHKRDSALYAVWPSG